MTDLIAAALAAPIGWEISLLADHGPLWFLAVNALGALGLSCGLGAAIHAWERRRHTTAAERPLYDPEPPEHMPVAPDARRRAVRPADIHDAAIANLHDTTAHDGQQEGARP